MPAFATLRFDAGWIGVFDNSGYGNVNFCWYCSACEAEAQGISSAKLALQSAHDHADEHDKE